MPQNATALEGSIHTFECATNNPNFSILWFVDNTNAHYERVRVRGFKSHYINQTFERLTALASLRNTNSSIDCLAVRPPGKGSFLRYDAERVYFMVKGKNELLVNYVDSFMPSHIVYTNYVPVSFVSYKTIFHS